MTDQEQRVAIAEACGTFPTGWPHDYVSPSERLRYVPDYINDMNAIRDAEESVFTKLAWHMGWEQFDTHLLHIAAQAHEHTTTSVIAMLRSTARQRAEAFLRTIGKWKVN